MKKVLFFLLILSGTVLAQERKYPDFPLWMTLGAWATDLSDGTSKISFQFGIKDILFQPEYLYKEKNYTDYFYKLHSLSLSAGKRIRYGILEASVFAGPTYILSRRSKYSIQEHANGPGVQANCQFIVRPVDEIGIGIGLYGSLNTVKSFSGIMLLINFGNGK